MYEKDASWWRPRPGLMVLAAAALFGASTPLAKGLLRDVAPIPFAGLLYLGSGLGAGSIQWIMRALRGSSAPIHQEARLRRSDLPWLASATLCGGVAAPIALLLGLRTTPAGTASLLLSFEVVATTLIAAAAFREAIGSRVWAAVACVTLASALLSLHAGSTWGVSAGALGVLASCALWGLDTNLTRRIAARDPLSIVSVKGLVGGAFTLTLAWALGSPLPPLWSALAALGIGCVSYGLSMVLFITALRDLRAARTAALFGTAPFLGAALSFLLFREAPGPFFLASGMLMMAGVALLLAERPE